MKWTKERPTVEGWYWIKYNNEDISPPNEQKEIIPFYISESCIYRDDMLWSGPIPEPED
jgi:hypothetical protein